MRAIQMELPHHLNLDHCFQSALRNTTQGAQDMQGKPPNLILNLTSHTLTPTTQLSGTIPGTRLIDENTERAGRPTSRQKGENNHIRGLENHEKCSKVRQRCHIRDPRTKMWPFLRTISPSARFKLRDHNLVQTGWNRHKKARSQDAWSVG